jgi:hypothetical protein
MMMDNRRLQRIRFLVADNLWGKEDVNHRMELPTVDAVDEAGRLARDERDFVSASMFGELADLLLQFHSACEMRVERDRVTDVLLTAFPGREEAVQEYFDEAEHQNGEEMWTEDYQNYNELIEDFRIYLEATGAEPREWE